MESWHLPAGIPKRSASGRSGWSSSPRSGARHQLSHELGKLVFIGDVVRVGQNDPVTLSTEDDVGPAECGQENGLGAIGDHRDRAHMAAEGEGFAGPGIRGAGQHDGAPGRRSLEHRVGVGPLVPRSRAPSGRFRARSKGFRSRLKEGLDRDAVGLALRAVWSPPPPGASRRSRSPGEARERPPADSRGSLLPPEKRLPALGHPHRSAPPASRRRGPPARRRACRGSRAAPPPVPSHRARSKSARPPR